MMDGGCFTRVGCSRVLSARVLGEGDPKTAWWGQGVQGEAYELPGALPENIFNIFFPLGGAKRSKQGVQS